MRKPVMAGNWKMNMTRDEALGFMLNAVENVPSSNLIDTIICAPAIILRDLVKRQGDNLEIGAENMHYEASGAFTGEISPIMLKTTGVKYVILGHSERRKFFGETDELVNLKIKAALANELCPIVCCGETLEEKEANKTEEVLTSQITKMFDGVADFAPEDVIVAYEPIWAIGTGKSATPEVANEGCKIVRDTLAKLLGKKVADKVRVLYGGSVKAATAKELYAKEDIDGFLVGKASLDAASFVELCNKVLE
jgi:triosephosphate isomerase